jgi:NAD(P)-dependent dehydrogenase (short-subunit alcohol dehydrogenase family)
VVNILDSRVAGLDPGHAAYHLSKRMLADMTTALARKLAPGVRVNAVAPGLILPPDSVTEGFPPRLADLVPMGRPGTVTDVTGALLFLLRSDYLTGQVIYADGGRHLVDNWRHGA